jgi:hypothetical protein
MHKKNKKQGKPCMSVTDMPGFFLLYPACLEPADGGCSCCAAGKFTRKEKSKFKS